MIESFLPAIDASDFEIGCGNWRKIRQRAVQILMGPPSATVEPGFD
jgi:hypothetical protein